MDSDDIFIGLKRRDETALSVLFDTYYEKLYLFAEKYIYDSDKAHDIVQDVFLKIWEKRTSIDPELGFDSYLFAIARNLVYKETENRLQSEQVNIALKDRSIETESLMEENIDADSLKEYIDTLVEQLPPSRKDIFHLSRRHHLSNKEIAARLSISEKTVETQLYRALRFIKQKLSDDTNLAILMLLMIKGC